MRRGAALLPPRQHRADRLRREVAPLPAGPAGRGPRRSEIDRITRPRSATPELARQGARRHRARRRRLAVASFAPASARGTVGDHDLPGPGPRRPGRPVHRRRAAQRRATARWPWSTGSSWRAGHFRRTTPPPGRPRRRPARRLAAAGAGRHPRPLPAGPRRSARWACRCSSGSTGAPCRRSCGWPSVDYAAVVAEEFCQSLVAAGTTTALVFGSHFAGAVDQLFTGAQRHGLRVTSGLVVSDRGLPEPLLTTPERAHEESLALACRWHGDGRARYAVTPRFSLSASEAMLEACAPRSPTSAARGSPPTSTRTSPRSPRCAGSSGPPTTTPAPTTAPACSASVPCSPTTCTPPTSSWTCWPSGDAAVAHCPSSNSALGSGLFPLTRHVDHGVAVALGSDVGAGTGFSLFKEGLQAYFMQRLLGPDGLPLTAGPPAPPRHRRRRPRAGPGRPGRRPVGRQGVRRDLPATGPRHRARHRPAPHRLAPRRRSARSSPWPPTPTSPTSGWVVSRSPPAASSAGWPRARDRPVDLVVPGDTVDEIGRRRHGCRVRRLRGCGPGTPYVVVRSRTGRPMPAAISVSSSTVRAEPCAEPAIREMVSSISVPPRSLAPA